MTRGGDTKTLGTRLRVFYIQRYTRLHKEGGGQCVQKTPYFLLL
jgi:hypothetical protein